MPPPPPRNRVQVAEFLREYAKAKNWRIRKIKTIQHMMKALFEAFDQSMYQKINEDLLIYENQAENMRNAHNVWNS